MYQNFGGKTLPFGQHNQILAITGLVGVREDAVEIALVGNVIDRGYTAYIADATVNSGGLATVRGKNNSAIVGVSAGVAMGTDGAGLKPVFGHSLTASVIFMMARTRRWHVAELRAPSYIIPRRWCLRALQWNERAL